MSGDGRRIARRDEQGYSFVILVVIVTVMNVMLAAALPVWSTIVQREKEEELIARGLQYAEAVRVFQTRFGRVPNQLEELIEVQPRSIRQLWKDPMTEHGEWGIWTQAPQGGARPVKLPPPPRNEDGQHEEVKTIGPIAGVYSLSTEDSLKVFFNKTRHDEWPFYFQIFTAQGGIRGFGVPGANATNPIPQPIWVRARPFRPGLTPQGLPGGLPAGLRETGGKPGDGSGEGGGLGGRPPGNGPGAQRPPRELGGGRGPASSFGAQGSGRVGGRDG